MGQVFCERCKQLAEKLYTIGLVKEQLCGKCYDYLQQVIRDTEEIKQLYRAIDRWEGHIKARDAGRLNKTGIIRRGF